MLSFVELMEGINTLSKDEIIKVKKAVEQRWFDLQRVEQAGTTRRTQADYDLDTTTRATTPEENKKWPNNIQLC